MGFLLGTTSSFHHPLPQSNSSSSLLCGSFLPCCHRKLARGRKMVLAMASPPLEEGEGDGRGSCWLRRRAILMLSISALPLSQLGAMAGVSPVRDKPDFTVAEVQQPGVADNSQDSSLNDTKKLHAREPPEKLYLFLLNAAGIIGTGVLSALYAITQKDMASIESTVESMKTQLSEKEDAIISMEKGFETKMIDKQEEHQRQVKKLKVEEAALSNKLASANVTIAALGKELQSEKQLLVQLQYQVDQLRNSLSRANEEKNALSAKVEEKMEAIDVLEDKVSLVSLEIKDKENSIESLKSSLAEKQSECENLNSIIDKTKADCEAANSAVDQLKMEVLQTREELDSRYSLIDGLEKKLESLVLEKEESQKKLHALKEDYNDLKSASVKKTDLDSKLLSKKDDELRQVEEKIRLVVDEVENNSVLIANLTEERDSVTAMLEEQINNVKYLQEELQTTQENLIATEFNASNLSKHLAESEKDCETLKMEISKVEGESSEMQNLLRSSLDEARATSNMLTDELVSVKNALSRTKEELYAASEELKLALENQANLKKELLEIYKKAESTSYELKEERNAVASLIQELEASVKQTHIESESRKALEKNLDEATRALDEMNRTVLSLSQELESARSRAVGLEADKEVLYKSLKEQSKVTQEAKENIEDAQDLIRRLGAERDSLETKGRRLEEELAVAKGEILRIRRKINMITASSIEEAKNANETEASMSAMKKNGSRRTKGGPDTSPSSSSEVSQ